MKEARKKARPSYHHGDLRRVLLDASIEVLAESGIEAMSLRDVARRAGVSPAAPYHHFASKDALLEAIAIDGFAQLAGAMTSARDAAGSAPTARLRAIGEAYVRFALDRPAHFHVMFRRSPAMAHLEHPAPDTSFRVLLDAATEVLAERGIAERVTHRELVVIAWSVVHGAASLLLDGPMTRGVPQLAVTPEEVPALVTRTLETLLSAPSTAGVAREADPTPSRRPGKPGTPAVTGRSRR